ncbi:ABC transporter substrate-binding protein [Paenibacillus sp. MWE-103]|uniref:ABC transporter substrate-binding protein n=1 Tax=Paenibacillus artemisiicola TaxID=1172618 RepID=A0ABS3WJG6_9BACL|nr:ABC transporter substrate-binding protein [Paenibacillus artemisiicola]MBO7748464.1 ABC transporter substrate-binding protein [Paenibacillus artemisiicola]
MVKKLLTRGKAAMLLLLLVLFAAGLLLEACDKGLYGGKAEGLPADAPPSEEGANGSGGPVTISFWFPWGGGFKQEFYDTVVKPFEDANPDIKVELSFVENSNNSQSSEKLLTAVAGGSGPDVAMVDRFIVSEWAAKDALEDVTEEARADGMAGIYYPGVWSETQYAGRTYALPWNVDARAMFYNKTLMKQAGLDPGKPPRTIAELDAMAARMFKTGAAGKFDQVGFIPWQAQGFLYTYGWAFGGEWERGGKLTPNDPRNVKALAWMQGYGKKYGAGKLGAFADELRQADLNPFLSGRVGFAIEGNWLLNDIASANFEWGVAPMPTIDGGSRVSWAGGWSFVMPKGAKHREQAWRFMRFVAGKEGSLLWAGRAAGKNDLTCIPEVNAQLGLDKQEPLNVFVKLLQHARIRPVTPVGGYMWDELVRAQNLAVKGQGDPQALLDGVKRHLDARLSGVEESRSGSGGPLGDARYE